MLPVGHYLFLSFGLFLIGIVGALLRRNSQIIAMSIALVVSAAAINFLTFSRFFGDPAGQNFALILCCVAFAEAVVFAALLAKHSASSAPGPALTSELEIEPVQTLQPPDVRE